MIGAIGSRASRTNGRRVAEAYEGWQARVGGK